MLTTLFKHYECVNQYEGYISLRFQFDTIVSIPSCNVWLLKKPVKFALVLDPWMSYVEPLDLPLHVSFDVAWLLQKPANVLHLAFMALFDLVFLM